MQASAAARDPEMARFANRPNCPVGRRRRRAVLSHAGRRVIGGASLLLSLWAQPVGAAAPCDRDCAGVLACEQRAVACLCARDQGRAAVERLKVAVEQYPERRELARLLAATYQAEGNTFWAQRTLNHLIEGDPSDCASRGWLAWIHVQQGDLDLAEEALAGIECPTTGPERTRWSLLRLLIARARQDPDASQQAMAELSAARSLYREDARVLTRLRQELGTGWMAPFHWRAELSAGATSNAGSGLPVAQAGTELGSPLGKLELLGRMTGSARAGIRPVAELGVKGQYLDAFDAHRRSAVRPGRYVEATVRPGLMLGSGAWRATVSYRADAFVLNRGDAYGDAPQVYHEGHRAELELERHGGLMVFAGAGRRLFRHRARSRWETDGGLGWSTGPVEGMHLLMALSWRRYVAQSEAYTQTGATLLAVSRWMLPGNWLLRVGATAGRDRYADTAVAAGGRDLLVRSSLQVWAPVWHGVQVGAVQELARRASNASVSYSYTEFRGFLKLRVALDYNPFGPAVVGPGGRVPLPVAGSNTGAGLGEERIRDLLRQDEAARRGSSCAN